MKKCLAKLLLGTGILIASLGINSFLADAETNYVVEMSSSTDMLYGEESSIDITITFHDKAYYNEQVYFSYHVEDMNGNEIRFENERYPVVLDGNAQAKFTIMLNFAEISSLTEEKEVRVCFDLVDQKNLYWFSQKEDVVFEECAVTWVLRGIEISFLQLKNEIIENKLLFVMNLFLFSAFCGTTFYIRVKRER